MQALNFRNSSDISIIISITRHKKVQNDWKLPKSAIAVFDTALDPKLWLNLALKMPISFYSTHS